jgi:hypothetical protein
VRVERVNELLVLEVFLSELTENGIEVEFEAGNGVLEFEGIEDFGVKDTHVADVATVKGDMSTTARHPSRIGVVSNKFEVLDLVISLLLLMSILETNRAGLLHDQLNHSLDYLKVGALIENHAADFADVTSSCLTSGLEDTTVRNLEHFLGDGLLLILLESH